VAPLADRAHPDPLRVSRVVDAHWSASFPTIFFPFFTTACRIGRPAQGIRMHRIILLITASASLFAAESGGPAGAAPATAPAGGAAPGVAPVAGADQGSPYGMLIMMAGFIAIFYFFMIRPQQKAEKARKALIAATKTGQKVVTIGGLHGDVVAVGETTVDIRVGTSDKESVVMTFNKAAIATNLSAEADSAKK